MISSISNKISFLHINLKKRGASIIYFRVVLPFCFKQLNIDKVFPTTIEWTPISVSYTQHFFPHFATKVN